MVGYLGCRSAWYVGPLARRGEWRGVCGWVRLGPDCLILFLAEEENNSRTQHGIMVANDVSMGSLAS